MRGDTNLRTNIIGDSVFKNYRRPFHNMSLLNGGKIEDLEQELDKPTMTEV